MTLLFQILKKVFGGERKKFIVFDESAKMNKIIKKYFDNFNRGKTYNFYIDKLRYTKSDRWATTDEWVENAEVCIKNDTNLIQALEILAKEKPDKYMQMAKDFLLQWYKSGAYDFEYYFELVASMPFDCEVRKNIIDDYMEYVKDYDSSFHLLRESLIRNNDTEFCEVYGNYLDGLIKKYQNNNKELCRLLENEHIINLGTKASLYISQDSLDIIKQMLIEYLQKDKELALKIVDGYIPDIENEQILWIADYASKVAFYMGWYDILEYLCNQEWYWLFLFDVEYGYEDSNNTNLLIWSQYTKNDILIAQAKKLIASIDFQNNIDGVITLSRMDEKYG
jgi:hypothetical protein